MALPLRRSNRIRQSDQENQEQGPEAEAEAEEGNQEQGNIILPERDAALSDEEQYQLVRRLFLDKRFPGSFSGIRTMQREIYLRRHIHVNINIIVRALRSIPSYLYHLTPVRRNQPTGHEETFTIGENMQGDNFNAIEMFEM